MRSGDAADDTLSGKLAQALDRIDGVDIALITAAIEIDLDMADQQILQRRIGWQEPHLCAAKWERPIARPDQRGAAYDGDTALGQWWS